MKHQIPSIMSKHDETLKATAESQVALIAALSSLSIPVAHNAQVGSTNVVVPDLRVKLKEDQAKLMNAAQVAAVELQVQGILKKKS